MPSRTRAAGSHRTAGISLTGRSAWQVHVTASSSGILLGGPPPSGDGGDGGSISAQQALGTSARCGETAARSAAFGPADKGRHSASTASSVGRRESRSGRCRVRTRKAVRRLFARVRQRQASVSARGTAKAKARRSLPLPFSTYSAPGGLRQGPGGSAKSSTEATTCGNGEHYVRVLSTYGGRGDVEPRVGPAVRSRALGAVTQECTSPGWTERSAEATQEVQSETRTRRTRDSTELSTHVKTPVMRSVSALLPQNTTASEASR